MTPQTWRGRRILALLCAVASLDFIDAPMTNVALPHIMPGAARTHHLLDAGTAGPEATTSGLRYSLGAGAAFAVAAVLLALATANTHEDSDEAHEAELEPGQPQAVAGAQLTIEET